MVAKLKVDQLETVDGTGIITVNNPLAGDGSGLTALNATALTGNLPAIDGSSLTGVGVAGISSSADATAITIDSDEQVGIKTTPRNFLSSYASLSLGGKAFLWNVGDEFYVGNNAYHDGSWKYTTTDQASYIKQVDGAIKFEVAPSGTADSAITWTDALEITNDGRGLSQFTAKAWCNFNGTGTVAIKDSHNISSITDNTTGDWTANYTVTFAPTYEHCVLATTGGTNDSGRNDSFAVVFHNLTSGCRVRVFDISSGVSDIGSISVLAFSS